jgi:drug/metabolite transporter (DMT)-like permease
MPVSSRVPQLAGLARPQTLRSAPLLGEVCALSAAFTWSVSVILFKRSEEVSPLAMNLFKNLSASLLLAITLLVLGQGLAVDRSVDDWLRLALSGVLGIALADTLFFVALRRLGASLTAVVDCAYAPTSVLMGVVFLHEPVRGMFLVGAALVVGGVLFTTRDRRPTYPLPTVPAVPAAAPPSPRPTEPKPKSLLAGISIGIVAITFTALGVILAKPVLEHSSLVEVTLVRLCAGVVGQLAWVAVVPGHREALGVLRPSRVWRTLMPASFLGSYIAMMLWLGGFKWTTVSSASVLNQMATVFTLILARVMLGEPLTKRRAIGSACAIAGAVLVIVD